MLARAIVRDPSGREYDLGHGDLVGRLATAALPLDDGRISEAHAMVSLREGQLQLLPLRGALAVGRETVPHVALCPGLSITLAPGVQLEVVEVWLPDTVLGVEAPTLPRQILPSVASLLAEPTLRLVRGWREGAPAHLWNDGETWTLRTAEGTRPVAAGARVRVGAHLASFVELPLGEAGRSATRQRLDAPLRVVAHFDHVQIHRDGRTALVLGGRPARLIGELVACECPVGWEALASALWPEAADDPPLLRSRLDVVLSRIRGKLRAAGIRADLVSTDGAGTVSLVLGEADRIEDHS